MKRRIYVLLLICCLLFAAVPVFAGAATEQQVTANTVAVTAGDTATVTLKAENFSNIAALDVYIYYDAQVLSVSSTGNGSMLSGAQSSVNTAQAGTITLSAMALNGMSGSGTLLTVNFATKADCIPGTYPITVAIGRAYSGDLSEASVGSVNGSVTVNEPVETEAFAVYNYTNKTTLQKGDTVSCRIANSQNRSFASGEFVVEYDHEVFAFDSVAVEPALAGEGAVYSVNSSVLGQVRIVYANVDPIKSFYLFTVNLTVIADRAGTTTIKTQATNMYRPDLTMYLPGSSTRTLTLQKLPETEDQPNAFFRTDRLVVGRQAGTVFCLEAGAGVAAADFTLTYDPGILRCVSVTAAEGLVEKGGMVVINDNFDSGTIRFSYINMEAYDAEDLPLVRIVWEPLQSPQEHYEITSDAVGVVDAQQNTLGLEHVKHTGCIYTAEVTEPTCKKEGLVRYLCACGDAFEETIPTIDEADCVHYTVAFLNGDVQIAAGEYHLGDEITIPADPVKASDHIYTYTFAGWDKPVVSCAGEATYTATYDSTYINYTVVFKDWDGTVISTQTCHWGDEVTAPADPVRAADHTYTYTFAGWDSEVVACAGNATYTAAYDPAYIDYTVVFKNWDGTVLSTQTYHWGDEVTAPADPVRAADHIYTYTFAGWDKPVVSCAGDATYTAAYDPAYIDYTVVFKNWDGTVLSTQTCHWGDEVTAPADPVRAADHTYTYTFAGWDSEVVACAGNATYTAAYDPAYIGYTVVFKNWDGTVLSTQTYHWGDEVTAPVDPTRASGGLYVYTFTGWDQPVVNCAGNATYTATYQADYIFIYSVLDGEVTVTGYRGEGGAVTVPEAIEGLPVTGIGKNAFYNCRSITSVTIPNGVTSIGDYAFYDCPKLTSVVYCGTPEQWNAIEISAGNSYLTGATVQFHNYQDDFCTICGAYVWEYSISNGEVTITGYFGNETNLVIPGTIENLPVTAIGWYAFYNSTGLTQVSIPNTVTEIGMYAFSGCTGLTTITIHDNVTTIGGQAFDGCAIKKLIVAEGSRNITPTMIICKDTLEEIVIPNSVIYIDERELQNSPNLTTVTFANNSQLTTLGYGTFNGCAKLTNVNFGENSRLTTIEGYAFRYCTSLQSIVIPDTVTGIGTYAFAGCIRLAEIVIPDGVSTIEPYVFNNCKNLVRVHLGTGIVDIKTAAFKDCSNLPSITIPGTVTAIGGLAFEGCSALENVYFDENIQITQIATGLFKNCSSLSGIAIPDKVKSIGTSAFEGCSVLANVSFGENTQITTIGEYAFDHCTSLAAVTIPEGVRIGRYAFRNCSSLTSVASPNAYLSEGVFSGCGSLQSITFTYDTGETFGYFFGTENYSGGRATEQTYYDSYWEEFKTKVYYIPATLTSVTVTSGEIPEYAFENCTNLTDVKISCPDTELNVYAFRNCMSLESVIIEAGVTAINGYAFYNCSALKNILIPETVTFIGWQAFYNCKSLENITIPDSVTEIGDHAFSNCINLTSVTIPDSVTSIGLGIFGGCRKLVSVTIPFVGDSEHPSGDKYPLGYIFGGSGYDNGMVPIQQNYYRGDSITNWTYYFPATLKTVTVTGGDIPAYAFHNCTELTSITLPENTTAIGMEAFRNCSSLTNIVLPANITLINSAAFTNCSELSVVFFRGTKAAHEEMKIASNNYSLLSAQWHYQAVEAEFAEQSCYYCSECNNYFLPDGNYAMATVIFKNWDGQVFETKQFKFGDAVQPSHTPIRTHENPLVYKWVFDGWDRPVVNCAGNAEYTAAYLEAYVDYAVVFKDWDGTVLSSKIYHWGDTVTAPANPTKVADNTYTYTFAGWNTAVVPCAGDATYTATYTSVYIDYTITFKNWDGTVLSSKIYHWGDVVTAPANPTKAADNTYTYTFAGWDKEVVACAGNTTYTATYISSYIDYTVIFKNWDGTVLSTKTYHYGDKVTAPSDPSKAADHTYTYAFTGWDSEVVNCAGNATYTATYASSYIDYTVIFKDWDGTVLSTKTYHYGDKVTAPSNPTKAADNTYTYTFAGWDKTVVSCEGDATYTATYESTYIDYTVVFKDWDGTVLSSETYHWGDVVIAPENPTKAADNTYRYTFAGWDNPVVNCAGDATYKATYNATYIDYKVVFKDADGTVLSSQTYHWGDVVTAPSNPTKAADNTYTYTFAGWDKPVVNCAGDVTYTATYKAAYIDYVVKFLNEDGTVLSTKTYHWGDVVTAPSNPTKAADHTYTYAFTGWDSEVVNCAGNATYKATYNATYINYTVVFKNWDGTVLSSKTYHYGDAVSAPGAPTRPNDDKYAYTFVGWDKTVVNCAGDATYTAVYSAVSLVPNTITSSTHTVRDGIISKITVGTITDQLINALNEKSYAKVFSGTTEVPGSALVGTGMEVRIMDGDTVTVSATAVVTGDINGDGKITVTDFVQMKAHLLKKSTLQGASAHAADTSGDGNISVTDFVQMKAHLLGKNPVQPQSVPATTPVSAALSVSQNDASEQEPVAAVSYTHIVALVPDKKTLITV